MMKRPKRVYLNRAKKVYDLKELERLGLTPEPEQREQILTYFSLIYQWNPVAGLVSKNDEANLFIRHFCDSLQPLLLFGFKKDACVLDIGAGGGFPSIPTRIFRPDLSITLVDSNRKKAGFLREVIDVLGFSNVSVVNRRVEKYESEGRYDYVVSRGVGTLQKFSSLAKPFICRDGRMYSFKSKDYMKEVESITENKSRDGVKISEIAEYDLGNQIFGLRLISLACT